MQKTFAPFGSIQEIRVFKDKGYAFIRYAMTARSDDHLLIIVALKVFNEGVGNARHRCGAQHRDQRSDRQVFVGQRIGRSEQRPYCRAAPFGHPIRGFRNVRPTVGLLVSPDVSYDLGCSDTRAVPSRHARIHVRAVRRISTILYGVISWRNGGGGCFIVLFL